MELTGGIPRFRAVCLVGIGTLLAVSVMADPYLRYVYYAELEDELPLVSRLYVLPYLPTGIILLLFLAVGAVLVTYLSLTRLRRDQVLLFAVLSTLFINYFGLIHVHVTLMLVSTGLFLLFLRGAMAGRFDIVWLPIKTYYIVLILIMILSVYGPLGRAGITFSFVFRFVTGELLPVIFLANVIRTRMQLLKAIQYLAVLALFVSMLGIGQYFAYKLFGIDVTMTWLQELSRSATLPVFGTFIRVGGLSGNSNTLAQATCTVGLLLTFFLLKPVYFSRGQRAFFLVTVIAILFSTIFSVSRGSWLALCVCFVIIPFIAFPRYSRYYILAYGVIGAVGYLSGFFEYMIDALEGIRQNSLSYREYIAYIGWDAIRTYPWTGVGFGSIGRYWNWDDAEVHNLWLNLWAQVGALGPTVLLLYLLSLVYRLLRAVLRTSGLNRVLLQSYVVTVVFFGVATMVRPLIWDKFFWIFFGFVDLSIHVLGKPGARSRVYYPIFGYSWKEEPDVEVDGVPPAPSHRRVPAGGGGTRGQLT